MQKVVTVIPTFNRRAHLAEVLRNLNVQEGANLTIDIVVVVDGSTDGTLEMLASDFPDVHVVQGEGDWWYTRSMNEGFQRARSLYPDYILTMNDDVRLPSNYVKNLLAASNAQSGSSIMGSISVTEEAPHRITFSGVKDIKWWRYKYVHYLPQYAAVDLDALTGIKDSMVLPGRGMLIPAGLLKALKGFDPKMVQYGSDDDFCLRAAKHGVGVKVCYDAVVYSYDKMTGVGNPSRKDSLLDVLKGFKNRYSTLYLPKTIETIRRHGNIALMPLTILIIIAASIRANLKYRKA